MNYLWKRLLQHNLMTKKWLGVEMGVSTYGKGNSKPRVSDDDIRHTLIYTTLVPTRVECWPPHTSGYPLIHRWLEIPDTNKTRAATYNDKANICLKRGLGSSPTVLSRAELFAIEFCSRRIGDLPSSSGPKSIKIFTDSEVAVRIFSSGLYLSKTAWSCHEALNIIWETNSVTLMWIPGYSGFTGNARKKASEETFNKAKWSISKWCNEEHSGSWLRMPDMVHSNEFMNGSSKTRTDSLLQLSRQHLKAMMALYILLRFSRGFTQSQFNSTINNFIYTSKHSVQ